MSWLNEWDFGVNLLLALSLLVMLYALALLNRAVRLLQYKMGAVEKDIALLSEEIKLLSSGRKTSVDLSDWAQEEGLAPGGAKTERK